MLVKIKFNKNLINIKKLKNNEIMEFNNEV